jgi:DNA helicase-2/ATP-dependent DNA helicase PcrA
MEQLTLCYAEKRRLYGEETYSRPSRFISEIPPELLEEIRMQGLVRSAERLFDGFVDSVEDSDTLKLGQRVFHQKFGEGVVLNYEGQGRHARVQVNFENAGSKWLVMEYANLVVTA